MIIVFASQKLRRISNSARELQRNYGVQKARKIRQRLIELLAAETLADISHLPPPRCHALTGDRAGQFAVTTSQRFRLILEPANDPIPYLEDGSINLTEVTAVRILDVDTDYHG